jgi:hypothetical protein
MINKQSLVSELAASVLRFDGPVYMTLASVSATRIAPRMKFEARKKQVALQTGFPAVAA